MEYLGGFITKNPPLVTADSASGVWRLSQAQQYIQQGAWPGSGQVIIETFTASSAWTCPEGVTFVEYLVVAFTPCPVPRARTPPPALRTTHLPL